MAKAGEIQYFSAIGAGGRHHASGRPFTDQNCGQYLARIGQIMALLPAPPARILDMGCGTGWTSSFLALRGYEVVGVDIAPDMIDAARDSHSNGTSGQLTFDVSDYESAPYREEFDAVVFFDSLHHADDELAALNTAFRALRPGGTCVTSEPGVGHHKTPASRRAIEEFGVNEKDMPPTRIIRLGKSAGFRKCRTIPHEGQIFALLNLPARTDRGGLSGWVLNQPILRPLLAILLIIGLKYRSGVVVLTK